MSSIPYIRQSSSNVRMPKDYGYAYAEVNNWAGLEDLIDPKEGDVVSIKYLPIPPGGIVPYQHLGEAVYTSESWKLTKAEAFSKVMLDEYITVDGFLAVNGCIGIVCGNAAPTASSDYYYWSGTEWLRTPDGTGYIHPNAATWGALPSDNLQDGDEVYVEFLGIETSHGIAKWSETAEDWELQEVSFGGWNPYSFSAVFVDIGTIADGAIIRTDDGADGAPIYFWNNTGSEWVRSPEDVAYTWSPATLINWAGLTSLQGILAGDRAEVGTWTTGGTAGVARYDGTDWRLVEGVVNTIANLLAFSGEIEPGAKVTVGTGISADPVYFWSGTAWVRTANGSHYIWPQVNNWSELTTLLPHAINNDEVHVNSLGPDHASGTAQMHGGTWKLIEGKWPSVSAMNLWSEGDIHSGAIAFVDTGHPHPYDEDSTVYYYTGGAWVQTGPPSGAKVFTLTSLRDFTGSGLTDGDYGYYGNELYRYNSAVPITGGGADQMWLPPAVYSGTVNILGKIVGTETIGTLPVTTGGVTFAVLSNPNVGSTITQSSDYIQFQTTTYFGTVMSGSALFTISSGTRTYMQADIAVSYSGINGAYARILATEGSGQPAWWFHLGPSGSTGTPYFAIGTGIQGTTDQLLNGGTVFPTTASGIYDTTEFIDYGRNLATECLRNGIPYARSRRSSTNTGPATPNDGLGFYVQGGLGAAGGTLTFRVKNWRILTW